METTTPNELASEDNAELHARRIAMPDGRYLIFFTFGNEPEKGEQAEENV